MRAERPNEPPPRPTELSGRIPALDGLRGLAIVMVMAFHQTAMRPTTALDYEFVRLSQYLAAGVDLFFVLSGFLITGILYDAKTGTHYFRNFYARRFLRIFPLYYAVLFVALVVLPRFPHPKLAKWEHFGGLGQVWYWLFLSNWSIALGGRGFQHGMIDLSWTLSIEEQFYLIWPVVVLAFDRRRLMRICVGLVGGALAVRLGFTLSGRPGAWSMMLTPSRMDTLAVGAWIALAARGAGGIGGLVPAARWLAIISGLVVAALIVPSSPPAFVYALRPTVNLTALAIFFGSLLVLAVGTRPAGLIARVFEMRFLQVFGVYSYALYLFHNPIQAAIRDTVYGPSRFATLGGSPLPGQLVFYVVAAVPTLACAWLSWHLYEAPLLKLKRFFPAGRGQAATAKTRASFEGGRAGERSGCAAGVEGVQTVGSAPEGLEGAGA
jgi:peptidoglycan/LPS O-acetylase OafA/YrhL